MKVEPEKLKLSEREQFLLCALLFRGGEVSVGDWQTILYESPAGDKTALLVRELIERRDRGGGFTPHWSEAKRVQITEKGRKAIELWEAK